MMINNTNKKLWLVLASTIIPGLHFFKRVKGQQVASVCTEAGMRVLCLN